MKYLYLILILSVLSCKKVTKVESPVIVDEKAPVSTKVLVDSIKTSDQRIKISKAEAIELKQKMLIEQRDERTELKEYIIEKNYFKEEDGYTIDFTYPLLDEDIKASNVNFNNYINDYYVDIIGTEAQILEVKDLLCDTTGINKFREKRFIDYKVYNLNNQLVSILFYKENYYTGTLHPTYSFDCINFDLDKGIFMYYEDFFMEGSESKFIEILNNEITEQVMEGSMYYDCWELSYDDFLEYKDNFVLNENYVEYYFDDCVMCPSYTGSYSIKIPVNNLIPVLRKYDLNPLVL
ncbi:RsiV family protein [Spongiivirga citrea]|uniref:DUF3298 domain-containing protein n=1 Tax=Spongiivirga citrea TaxID=1481457 RepID=A0A6M0CG11_9FLAO|nr:RsiV family protein [Spongiivirga citrea]NER16836.1 DUF3298 domain-containing protein [Spongiivirga citrea]